jgi:hypothetical protein
VTEPPRRSGPVGGPSVTADKEGQQRELLHEQTLLSVRWQADEEARRRRCLGTRGKMLATGGRRKALIWKDFLAPSSCSVVGRRSCRPKLGNVRRGKGKGRSGLPGLLNQDQALGEACGGASRRRSERRGSPQIEANAKLLVTVSVWLYRPQAEWSPARQERDVGMGDTKGARGIHADRERPSWLFCVLV